MNGSGSHQRLMVEYLEHAPSLNYGDYLCISQKLWLDIQHAEMLFFGLSEKIFQKVDLETKLIVNSINLQMKNTLIERAVGIISLNISIKMRNRRILHPKTLAMIDDIIGVNEDFFSAIKNRITELQCVIDGTDLMPIADARKKQMELMGAKNKGMSSVFVDSTVFADKLNELNCLFEQAKARVRVLGEQIVSLSTVSEMAKQNIVTLKKMRLTLLSLSQCQDQA